MKADFQAPLDVVKAPWTPEHVRALHQWQSAAYCLPAFCPNRHDGKHFVNYHQLGELVPTTSGWICQCCDFHQDWSPVMGPREQPVQRGAPRG